MWLEGEAKKAGFVLKKGSELLQCVVNKHIAELDKDVLIFVVIMEILDTFFVSY